jgi:membrane protein YqaA with SNARE-associated domain
MAGPFTCLKACVHAFFRQVFIYLIHLGALGPLILGVLDSSFLFFPFGNDFLLIILTSRDRQHLPWYVLTASCGSTIGAFLLDLVCRKGGQEGLQRMMKRKRFEYLKQQMKTHAALALMVACLAPPPFPFTVVVAAASAFQYAKSRLLGLIFVFRAVRFTLVGLLALWLGRQVIRIVNSDQFIWAMIGFIALCTVGSAIQVFQWVQRSRQPAHISV